MAVLLLLEGVGCWRGPSTALSPLEGSGGSLSEAPAGLGTWLGPPYWSYQYQ